MSDLISREALLKAHQDLVAFGTDTTFSVRNLINNAPEIERGEPVAWQGLGICTFEKPTTNSHLFSPLYSTPQQPQSVADALEEALGICAKIKTPDNFTDAEKHIFEQATTEYWRAIRALIKHNAEGVE